MNEIAPGVFHWTAFHPNIELDVSCYLHGPSATAIDPLLPGDGLGPLEGRDVARLVLTNRHHLRSGERIAAELGCPILCHEAGLHEFEGGPEVQGFAWGDELGPGVRALEVDAICDEETALLIDAGSGFLAVADAVMHYAPDLHFVPDEHLGDDPAAVKAAIREAYGRLLDQPFDSLLFAHGDPLVGGGKDALRRFVEGD